jgi:cytochrome oxidase Cu insertion factor (SCO1/SenC/PrrC family)
MRFTHPVRPLLALGVLAVAVGCRPQAPAPAARAAPAAAPEQKASVEVGAKAPAFTLKDQDGKERSLDEFRKKGTVAVVFYRSAMW